MLLQLTRKVQAIRFKTEELIPTPIYIAARLIQRFGMSTPPASYMLAVGGAFKSGASDGSAKQAQ